MKITSDQFEHLFPRTDASLVVTMNRALARYEITSRVRQAAFFAQVGHESNGLTVLVESLNYSADGLANTWPGRFRGPDGKPNDVARALHRKPRAIAPGT